MVSATYKLLGKVLTIGVGLTLSKGKNVGVGTPFPYTITFSKTFASKTTVCKLSAKLLVGGY